MLAWRFRTYRSDRGRLVFNAAVLERRRRIVDRERLKRVEHVHAAAAANLAAAGFQLRGRHPEQRAAAWTTGQQTHCGANTSSTDGRQKHPTILLTGRLEIVPGAICIRHFMC